MTAHALKQLAKTVAATEPIRVNLNRDLLTAHTTRLTRHRSVECPLSVRFSRRESDGVQE